MRQKWQAYMSAAALIVLAAATLEWLFPGQQLARLALGALAGLEIGLWLAGHLAPDRD